MSEQNQQSDAKLWAKIQSIFESTQALAFDQQKQYLDQACGDDLELRAEVESLLRYSITEDHQLEQVVGHAAGDAASGERANSLGLTIGPYRIIRELDQGGMGSVFLAERSDRHYHKRVAIKVLRSHLASVDIRQRFLAERQILANLDHPHIARLLDGGTTHDGLPYLVLEYIEGEPIHVYCEQNHLNVNQRLELFRKVCRAVAYAHHNLVVHRDLKPSNIVVTAEGEPKLLDFGIAKLLSPDYIGFGVSETMTHQRIFTPEYASPEQVRGEPITTASDVYSLGVLLYQLLTGSRPYRLNISRPADVERVICETLPPRPSLMIAEPETVQTGTGPVRSTASEPMTENLRNKLHRQLSGDLDNIVLMALRKEPSRRYDSVEQFSADIRRFLNHQPVLARRITWRYRSLRFLQRNLMAVSLAVLVFGSISALALVTSAQSVRIAHERDIATHAQQQAEQETAKLEAVSGFLHEMLASVDPKIAQGKEITVREVLDQTSEKLKSENALSNQPAVEATVRMTLGETYGALGIFKNAEQELNESIRLFSDDLGDRHVETIRARLNLASTYIKLGKVSQSQALVEEIQAICTQYFPVSDPTCLSVGRVLSNVFLKQQDFDRSEKILLEKLEIARNYYGANQVITLGLISDLANTYTQWGRFDKAAYLYQEFFTYNASVLGELHPESLDALANYAVLNEIQGKLDKAETQYTRLVELYASSLGDGHLQTVLSRANLARINGIQGNLDLAEQQFKGIIKDLHQQFDPDHRTILGTEINLISIYLQRQDTNKAEQLTRSVSERFHGQENDKQELFAQLSQIRGLIYTQKGEFENAQIAFEESLDLLTELYGTDHYKTLDVRLNIAVNQTALGHYENAYAMFTKCLDAYARLLPADHPNRVYVVDKFEALLKKMGRGSEIATLRRNYRS